jgi:hypothetical protein
MNTEVLGGAYPGFSSAQDVCDLYGAVPQDGMTPQNCPIATEFFSGTPVNSPLLYFTRIPFGGARARLWGAPIQNNSHNNGNSPLNNMLADCSSTAPCNLQTTYDQSAYMPGGYTASVSVCFENNDTLCGGDGKSGNSLAEVNTILNNALSKASTPLITAVTSNSSVTTYQCYATGYVVPGFWEVSSVQGGANCPGNKLQVGGVVQLFFGQPGDLPLEVMAQNTGYNARTNVVGCHPVDNKTCIGGGPGEYLIWTQGGENGYTRSQSLEETYGVFTVGSTRPSKNDAIQQGEILYTNAFTDTYQVGFPLLAATGANPVGTCADAGGVDHCAGHSWIVPTTNVNVTNQSIAIAPCVLGSYLYAATGGTIGGTTYTTDGETDRLVVTQGGCAYTNPQGTINFATSSGGVSGAGAHLATDLGLASGAWGYSSRTANKNGPGPAYNAILSPCSQAFPTTYQNDTLYKWFWSFAITTTLTDICPYGPGATASTKTGAWVYFQNGSTPTAAIPATTPRRRAPRSRATSTIGRSTMTRRARPSTISTSRICSVHVRGGHLRGPAAMTASDRRAVAFHLRAKRLDRRLEHASRARDESLGDSVRDAIGLASPDCIWPCAA